MTVLQTMYPGQKDSPYTSLSGSILDSTTDIVVENASVLPTEVPFPLTIGFDGLTTEVVIVTGVNTGTNVITVTRSGNAVAWADGTKVARVFNSDDLNTIQNNITTLRDRKIYVPSFQYDFPVGANIRRLINLGNDTILAGTSSAGTVHKSTDAGLTWTDVGAANGWDTTGVYALATDGAGVVIAGKYFADIYRSADNGDTWTHIQQLGSALLINDLVYMGNNIFLAGVGDVGEIYRSIDGGLTWSFVQQLDTETYVYTLLNVNDSIALAGSNPTGQIYRSTDAGATWSLVQRLGGQSRITALIQTSSGVIIAGTGHGAEIYYSLDQGLTWTEGDLEGVIGSGIVLTMSQISDNTIVAPLENSVYVSNDDGVNWVEVGSVKSELAVSSSCQIASGEILMGTYPNGHLYIVKEIQA